jgi:hypothetical protein
VHWREIAQSAVQWPRDRPAGRLHLVLLLGSSAAGPLLALYGSMERSNEQGQLELSVCDISLTGRITQLAVNE